MRALIGCCLVLFINTPLIGRDFSQRFFAAQTAYTQGDFKQSKQIYLEAIQEGEVNASLFYNLGSSLYKNGEMGAALAANLRAEAIAPSDPDIQYNLKFILAQAKDKLETSTQSSWLNLSAATWFGERTLFWWATLALTAAFFSLALLLISGRSIWPRLLLSAVLACTGLYPALSFVEAHWFRLDRGAVVSDQVDVLASPTLKNSVAIFQLHQAAPFTVLAQSGEWFKIRISDGKTGWLLAEHVAIFGKKYFNYRFSKTALQDAPVAL